MKNVIRGLSFSRFFPLASVILFAACASAPEFSSTKEDPMGYASAANAGDSTVIVGSDCSEPKKGWAVCQVTEESLPKRLDLYFTGPAHYTVTDCGSGVFATGELSSPGLAEVDLSGMAEDFLEKGNCLMRIWSVENYQDQAGIPRVTPYAGGIFIEVLSPLYSPNPPSSAISWCYQLEGTNKGRRKLTPCEMI